MSKKHFLPSRRISLQRIFVATFLIFVFGLASCNNKVRLKGVVIDEINHLPVVNARVKTITGFIGRTLELAEVHTNREGVFEIIFNSNQVTAENLSVEVSKVNYLSNVYEVLQHSFDTIVLRRQTHSNSDIFELPNN